MMDAKARQDCVKEIGLLKVSAPSRMLPWGQALLWTHVLSSSGTGLNWKGRDRHEGPVQAKHAGWARWGCLWPLFSSPLVSPE